jgi:hypothetical protein
MYKKVWEVLRWRYLYKPHELEEFNKTNYQYKLLQVAENFVAFVDWDLRESYFNSDIVRPTVSCIKDEGLTAMTVKFPIFWEVTSGNPAKLNQYFAESFRLYF